MSLMVIIIISLFIFNLIGIVFAIPFWGTEAIKSLTGGITFNINNNIIFFKYLQIVNQLGMFVAPSLLFAYLINGNITSYLKMKHQPNIYTLIAGILLIIVSMPFVNFLISLNETMHLPQAFSGVEEWMRKSEDSAEIFTKAFLNVTNIQGLFINILMIAIIPAFGEEFLFRGILLKLFKEWTGNFHFAIFISAFLFSAMHLQFFGFFPRMFLGLLLGYMFYFSRNLWVPIIAHFFNNAFAVIISFLNNNKITQTDIDSLGSKGNDFWLIICSILLTVLLIVGIYKKEQIKKEEEIKSPSSLY